MATQEKKTTGTSFKQKLTTEELKKFNDIADMNFQGQAIAFLNAYWDEVGNQKDFIFNVSWEYFKKTDMHFKGVDYIHLYDEGKSLDFDAGIYFFEKINGYCDDKKNDFTGKDYKFSMPKMMTSIVRKKELKSKVDVNFDGRVSFIEYLLYQYQEMDGKTVCKPKDFCKRILAMGDENKYVREARIALEGVLKAIKEYEKVKAKLEETSKGSGVKALTAKNQLAQLETSDQKKNLNTRLIKAEAKIRILQKKFKNKNTAGKTPEGGTVMAETAGANYWYGKELENAKSKYGKGKKKKN